MTNTCPFWPVDEEKMAHYAQEERHIREENLRLQRKLQMEMERRENLCRHLSESESSLEMDDERYSCMIACISMYYSWVDYCISDEWDNVLLIFKTAFCFINFSRNKFFYVIAK